MQQQGGLLKPAGRGESLLQPESCSLLLYLIWIGSGSCSAVAYLLTPGVRIYARPHNSFSWACSSAVTIVLLKTFEVKRRGDPVWFNGKSNARLCRALLVTCVHLGVYLFGGQLSAVCPLSPHTLPSFGNLNGFFLCSRQRERGEDGDVMFIQTTQ